MRFGIGLPVARKEDPRFLTGRGRFVADVDLVRQAQAVFVFSAHAHARIRAIDKANAELKPLLKEAEEMRWVSKGGKLPYDEYFFESLEHHGRNGFLNQKLIEPRSYDYGRIRSWDDRLRMPQFKFARTKRLPKETDEQYDARALKEEAEGREAVMTFILGLTAEQIPAKFVYSPGADRMAEVKGRQVLDKFNCAGCHIIRPGAIDLKPTDVVADVGSGTGISAELFLRNGNTVYAIEPNAPMRAAAEAALGHYDRFHSRDGTSSATGGRSR